MNDWEQEAQEICRLIWTKMLDNDHAVSEVGIVAKKLRSAYAKGEAAGKIKGLEIAAEIAHRDQNAYGASPMTAVTIEAAIRGEMNEAN